MSTRRRPRTQRRVRQPRTLRTRLVVSAVTLIAVVCAVIGTVTTIALGQHLDQQKNAQVTDAGRRAAGLPRGALDDGGPPAPGGSAVPPVVDSTGTGESTDDKLDFIVTRGGAQPGSVAAVVDPSGRIVKAAVAESRNDSSGGFKGMVAKGLNTSQAAALSSVPRSGIHTVDIPGLGEYRVTYVEGTRGNFYIGLSTADVTSTVNTLIVVEVSVTAAGLVAAGIAGYVLVGIATRPLRKVAATATRVSELPLHSGEVTLDERVPESETDPHTEVGRVGAALNRMLDHVHGALHARQQSEMRVRQFVADASHELRTPLASIRGYAELTRRGREQTGPDTRHALARIESEADRMTLLVEDLLLLARLDAGRPLRFEQTDLVPLVVDTVSDARAAGRDHNWRLELPDEPALVSADAARLQQVLVNLLANARTHTPPGTTVTIRVQRRGPWLCVDVHDDGQGIPAELLPHVFERFARGDSARSRTTGSTGLGLAIVQAVATAHGGAVTVDSVPGRTVFTMHVPAFTPRRPAPDHETKPKHHSQAHHSTTTWVRQGA